MFYEVRSKSQHPALWLKCGNIGILNSAVTKFHAQQQMASPSPTSPRDLPCIYNASIMHTALKLWLVIVSYCTCIYLYFPAFFPATQWLDIFSPSLVAPLLERRRDATLSPRRSVAWIANWTLIYPRYIQDRAFPLPRHRTTKNY